MTTCDLTVFEPESEVTVGETVTISGTPFTTILDTSVRFNGVEADVTGVERSDCTLCDQCKVSAQCTACESCEACTTSCETCTETTQLTVPDLNSGSYTVVFRNQYGQSIPSQWNVLQPSSNFDTASEEP